MPLHEKIQEMYNRVKYHLLTQNQKATVSKYNATCAYRTETGLKCAIGALIPEDKYLPGMERLGSVRCNDLVKKVLIEEFDLSGLSEDDQAVFMGRASRLQSIHDGLACETWPSSLYQFTTENKLIDTPMEQLCEKS